MFGDIPYSTPQNPPFNCLGRSNRGDSSTAIRSPPNPQLKVNNDNNIEYDKRSITIDIENISVVYFRKSYQSRTKYRFADLKVQERIILYYVYKLRNLD